MTYVEVSRILRPSWWARAAAALMVVLMLGAAVFVWPIRHRLYPVNTGLITVLGVTVGLFEMLTALLILGQFAVSHRRSSIFLHLAYMWAAIFAMLYAAAFPGVFATHGLGSPETSIYAWMAWHCGFSTLAIAYAVALATEGSPPAIASTGAVRGIVLTSTLFLLVAAGTTIDIVVWHTDLLPVILKGRDFSGFAHTFGPLVVALQLGALLAVTFGTRVQTTAAMWFAVSLVASFLDVWMAISVGYRGMLGWYLARTFTFLESGVLLVVLGSGVFTMQSRAAAIAARAARPARRRDAGAPLAIDRRSATGG